MMHMSWNDAQLYVQWLSERTGNRYRLPSESEWECVARAGTTTPFHTGLTISTAQANYGGGVRANRTARTEFWSHYDGELTYQAINKALDPRLDYYNNRRPHRALGMKTPADVAMKLGLAA